MVSPTTNFAFQANQARKKRGAREVEEIDQTTNRNLDRDLFLCSQCFKVLRSLKQHRFGWRFIDLDTIKSKLVKHLYTNIEDEFPEDVRLVFTKAMSYNYYDSSIYQNAEELKKFFEIRWEYLKKKLACEFSKIEVERPEASSCDNLYYTEKVSLQTNPVTEQRRSDQDSKGFVLPIPLSPKRARRAATVKKLACEFSETEVKRSPEKSEATSSDNFYYTEKVSLQTNPVTEQTKSDQDSKGFVVPMTLSPNRALRAATFKKLACGFSETEVERSPEESEESNSSDNLYYTEKVSLQTNPVEEQRRSAQDSKGFVLPMPLSPNRALRAATIKQLACESSEIEVKRSPEESEASSSDNLYNTGKVSLQTNPVEEQKRSDQVSKGFVFPIPLSPNRALRAATIKIRFADTIVKAKYRKQIDESGSNKAEVMMRIEREKQELERRQREEKARIEAEIRAPLLKRRHEERLALEKLEEEANPNNEGDHLVSEKEFVNLCGGSYLARTCSLERFGLVLKM